MPLCNSEPTFPQVSHYSGHVLHGIMILVARSYQKRPHGILWTWILFSLRLTAFGGSFPVHKKTRDENSNEPNKEKQHATRAATCTTQIHEEEKANRKATFLAGVCFFVALPSRRRTVNEPTKEDQRAKQRKATHHAKRSVHK